MFTQQQMMEMLQGFREGTQGASGARPLDGRYQFEIKGLELKQHPQESYPMFIAQLRVISSTVAEHPPGSDVEWGVFMKQNRLMRMYMNDVRRFLYAVYRGIDPNLAFEAMRDDHLTAAVDQSRARGGALVGYRVSATFETGPQKNDESKEFRYATWSAYSAADPMLAPLTVTTVASGPAPNPPQVPMGQGMFPAQGTASAPGGLNPAQVAPNGWVAPPQGYAPPPNAQGTASAPGGLNPAQGLGFAAEVAALRAGQAQGGWPGGGQPAPAPNAQQPPQGYVQQPPQGYVPPGPPQHNGQP